MTEYATREDIQQIVGNAVDKLTADLLEVIASFAQQMDTHFDELESRQPELDRKFERLLAKIEDKCILR